MTDDIPVVPVAPQLTQVGYDEIVKELEELETVRLPAIIQRVETARSHGDLSENSEYHSAKEDQELIETKIAELHTILATATIVKQSHKQNIVGIGSQVVAMVHSKSSKRKLSLHIVGEFEAYPKTGKISSASPLGKALIGKKKGDVVEVEAPAGVVKYEVVEIA